MTSYIEEFASKRRQPGYYERLLQEVEEFNKEYHAFNVLNEELSDDSSGMPFSSKANICVKGFETTASSRMLRGYVAPFDATVIERMLSASKRKHSRYSDPTGKNQEDRTPFCFLGETNMDEFGFGTFGINCETPARNAFDPEYAAGGSSSGAAVATASLKYHVAIAESTGGSISAPAALNGVVGFTPTYGAVSRYGLIDYANSLDKIGVMARSADDAMRVFDAIRGSDDYDTTCVTGEISDSQKKKVFVVEELIGRADEAIQGHFEKLLGRLEASGREIEHISMDILGKAIEPYYIIAMAEASTNLAKYTGFKYGYQYGEYNKRYNEFFTEARANFGTEAKRRLILGTFIRGESVKDKYYTKALTIRRMLIDEMGKVLKEGFILSPTLPIMTPKIADTAKLSPVQNYAMDIFTIPPNVGGFPHISFPYEYVDGMPIGAQLVTEQANDYALLDFVGEWERSFTYKFKNNLGDL
jgi:aspartyl-tRNA(Asn)/glutamyl-tRNA(Gln) amidotransferase subunit A